MIRLICALTSCIAAGCIGMRWASRLREDTRRLAGWLAYLDRLRLSIAQSQTTLPDALSEASCGDSSADQLCRGLAEALRSEPATSLHDHFQPMRTAAFAEDALIDRLMDALDRGMLESRLLAISQAREVLELMHRDQAARSARDAPMWTRLGWTAGACLFIMML